MRSNKHIIDILKGLFIGVVATSFGIFIWWYFFSKFDFEKTIIFARSQRILGMVISLSSLINFGLFFIVIKRNREIAKGILMCCIITALIVAGLEFI